MKTIFIALVLSLLLLLVPIIEAFAISTASAGAIAASSAARAASRSPSMSMKPMTITSYRFSTSTHYTNTFLPWYIIFIATSHPDFKTTQQSPLKITNISANCDWHCQFLDFWKANFAFGMQEAYGEYGYENNGGSSDCYKFKGEMLVIVGINCYSDIDALMKIGWAIYTWFGNSHDNQYVMMVKVK